MSIALPIIPGFDFAATTVLIVHHCDSSCPAYCTLLRPGLRITATSVEQRRERFEVVTDDAPAGLAELLDQLARHRAGV